MIPLPLTHLVLYQAQARLQEGFMFMATPSNEIKIQIGEEVKVLSADEATDFEAMRDEINASAAKIKAELEIKLNARKAVLAKLGLSDDEVNLILNLDEFIGGN